MMITFCVFTEGGRGKGGIKGTTELCLLITVINLKRKFTHFRETTSKNLENTSKLTGEGSEVIKTPCAKKKHTSI